MKATKAITSPRQGRAQCITLHGGFALVDANILYRLVKEQVRTHGWRPEETQDCHPAGAARDCRTRFNSPALDISEGLKCVL
jgi:hypothetical protein